MMGNGDIQEIPVVTSFKICASEGRSRTACAGRVHIPSPDAQINTMSSRTRSALVLIVPSKSPSHKPSDDRMLNSFPLPAGVAKILRYVPWWACFINLNGWGYSGLKHDKHLIHPLRLVFDRVCCARHTRIALLPNKQVVVVATSEAVKFCVAVNVKTPMVMLCPEFSSAKRKLA